MRRPAIASALSPGGMANDGMGENVCREDVAPNTHERTCFRELLDGVRVAVMVFDLVYHGCTNGRFVNILGDSG